MTALIYTLHVYINQIHMINKRILQLNSLFLTLSKSDGYRYTDVKIIYSFSLSTKNY